jgi:hypothetical protein
MVLTINSDCFPKQHYPAGLCSGDIMCFLWGTNWICVFCVVLTIKSYCFSKEHYPAGLCSGDIMCFLWGMNWICVFRMVLTINRDWFPALTALTHWSLSWGSVHCWLWGRNLKLLFFHLKIKIPWQLSTTVKWTCCLNVNPLFIRKRPA